MTEYRNEQGELHRTDGPARIWPNGTQAWYLNGELHRDDGPAVITSSGTQQWWILGKLHRTDGPAIVYADGGQAWWLNGKHYDQLTHMLLVNRHNTQITPQKAVL